jgi:hypothetical protein
MAAWLNDIGIGLFRSRIQACNWNELRLAKPKSLVRITSKLREFVCLLQHKISSCKIYERKASFRAPNSVDKTELNLPSDHYA